MSTEKTQERPNPAVLMTTGIVWDDLDDQQKTALHMVATWPGRSLKGTHAWPDAASLATAPGDTLHDEHEAIDPHAGSLPDLSAEKLWRWSDRPLEITLWGGDTPDGDAQVLGLRWTYDLLRPAGGPDAWSLHVDAWIGDWPALAWHGELLKALHEGVSYDESVPFVETLLAAHGYIQDQEHIPL